jgi:hypothetical protein
MEGDDARSRGEDSGAGARGAVGDDGRGTGSAGERMAAVRPLTTRWWRDTCSYVGVKVARMATRQLWAA